MKRAAPIFLFLFLGGLPASEEYFVSPTGDDSNDGLSPERPLRTVTRALRLAAPPATIDIADGTYGAAGGESFPLVVKGGTTLRGTGEAGPALEGLAGDTVILLQDIPPETPAVLENLTVSGGGGHKQTNPLNGYPEPCGGGISCIDATAEIRGCTVVNNTVCGFCGVGISMVRSAITIAASRISWNKAGCNDAGIGGGIACMDHSVLFARWCRITQNLGWTGGGIYCGLQSSATLEHCSIDGNTGNGIYADDGSSIVVRATRISSNTSDGDFTEGGGVGVSHSSAVLENCVLYKNLNAAGGGGGAMDLLGASVTISNCTIVGNYAGITARGSDVSDVTIRNTILWGNVTYGDVPMDLGGKGEFNISYSILGDPGLVDQTIGHYQDWTGEVVDLDVHLVPWSLAINAGSPVGAPETDFDGHGRPCLGGVDAGAYESGGCPGPDPLFIRGDANADGATDLSDAVALLFHLFLGDPVVPCEQAGDANDDGALDLSDPVDLLGFLFLGGRPIAPPAGACGLEPTGHALPCAGFAGCQ